MNKNGLTYRWLRPVCIRFVAFVLAGSVSAIPPHPSLQDESTAAKANTEILIQSSQEWHQRGICTPDDYFLNIASKINPGDFISESPALAIFRVLAILVEFSDNPSVVGATFFDSLVFSDTGNTVRDYFSEISFATIDLVTVNLPSSLGWQTPPQTYAYYVNGLQGTGSYPQNSQKLVEDLVDMVDPVVDFSNYDNNADGSVDILVIIHAGTGAELSGSVNDIWSHKWAISPRLKDGVNITSYTVQPEFWNSAGDMTIGVYAHELCHGFGLPDLYDTDGSSNGIGRWGVMSTGSWNGPTGFGESPAHPCAWSRTQMNIISPINVTTNLLSQSIAAVETGGDVYRLWTSGGLGNEYFLVENRQKTGYDQYLQGDGLLIWHIDEGKSGNSEEWYPGLDGANHYLVALEQADGLFELENRNDYGDAADPFPGSGNNTLFSSLTFPNSDTYNDINTFVEVANISASGANMTADLIVGIAAGIGDDQNGLLPGSHSLSQNYPNPFNPSTIIEFDLGSATNVELVIVNILGQRVATLIDSYQIAGKHLVEWEAIDTNGDPVASGVYFYRLVVEDNPQQMTKKMILIR